MHARRVVGALAPVMVIIVLLCVFTPLPVSAHLEPDLNSFWATTTPTINGTIAPGEWADASIRDFTLEMRDRLYGSLNRTLNARLYVKNDWANLYMAVQIFNDDYEAQDAASYYKGLFVLFDNNHTGVLSAGDNGEGITTYVSSTFYSHNDMYYTGSGWDPDANSAGKTNDGNLNWSHTNPVQWAKGNWTFEMRIPLVGSDGNGYDFNITSLPQTVGFKIWFVDWHWQRDGVYPDDPSINTNYDETTDASTYGNLIIHPLYTLITIASTGGTTNPAPGPHQYPFNTSVSVTATPDPNYVLHHWVLDSVNVGNATYPYTVSMDQNHTLEAVFWPLYALTTVATTGGTTNPAPGQYKYLNGTVVSVTATYNTGYIFHHWELDSVNVGSANPYSVTMDQNHTLKAVFYQPMSLSISPLSATIYLGDSVPFTSTLTGGVPPYGYQWFVNGNPVSGANSATWTFTPTSVGIYFVYLKVTDGYSYTVQSDPARIMVITAAPVGGYSEKISLTSRTPTVSMATYAALASLFGAMLSVTRRKRR